LDVSPINRRGGERRGRKSNRRLILREKVEGEVPSLWKTAGEGKDGLVARGGRRKKRRAGRVLLYLRRSLRRGRFFGGGEGKGGGVALALDAEGKGPKGQKAGRLSMDGRKEEKAGKTGRGNREQLERALELALRKRRVLGREREGNSKKK